MCGLVFALLALRLPAPPPDGLPRAQAFDYHITEAQKALLPGRVYFIWGAGSPRQPPGVIASKYLPIGRDPDRSHTLDWYRRNHPDWIMYQSDRVTPAWGFTYSHGNAMPIDIANPRAREYYFATYIMPAVAAGFPVIALDNAGVTNWDHRSGHYRDGKWVQSFSGQRLDPRYAAAVIGWLEYLRGRLHTLGVGLAANIKCHDEPLLLPDVLRREVEAVDLFWDEGGFTFHRETELAGKMWEAKVAFLQSVLPERGYICENPMTGPRPPKRHLDEDVESKNYRSRLAEASPRQVMYAIASFLIVRERGSMLTLEGQEEHGTWVDRPGLHLNIGAPTGRAVRLSTGAWWRPYERGLAAVNPSPSGRARVPLPPGRWRLPGGAEPSDGLELGPITGAVLERVE